MLIEIKENRYKWSNAPGPRIRRLNSVKALFLPELICRSDAIPIKTPAGFFGRNLQLVLKFIWKCRRSPRIIKNNFEKKNIVGELMLPVEDRF